MKKTTARAVWSAMVILVAVSAYRVGKAIAAGIPSGNPLVYSGVLLNNGSPVTAKTSVAIALYTTSGSFSSNACSQATQNVTPDSAGRFQIALDSSCVEAVHANPNLFVGLEIAGAQVPMTQLTAVPYAVEAAAADTASDGGQLQAQLASAAHPVVTNSANGLSTTVDGLPCGLAPSSTGKISTGGSTPVTGYQGAKTLCQSATGCGGTAHMCVASELIRAASLGISIPGASDSSPPWYATGFAALVSGNELNDCQGFTSATTSLQGSTWGSNGPLPSSCGNMESILCCN